MSPSELDQMTAFVVDGISARGADAGRIVYLLSESFPDIEAGGMVVALVAAAEGLAGMMRGGRAAATDLHRVAALLAADAYAAGRGAPRPPTGRDMLIFWGRNDPVFRPFPPEGAPAGTPAGTPARA